MLLMLLMLLVVVDSNRSINSLRRSVFKRSLCVVAVDCCGCVCWIVFVVFVVVVIVFVGL